VHIFIQGSSILSSPRQMTPSPVSLLENISICLVSCLLHLCPAPIQPRPSVLICQSPVARLSHFQHSSLRLPKPSLPLPLCKPYGLADKVGSMLIQEWKSKSSSAPSSLLSRRGGKLGCPPLLSTV
jgi:hypothetical protein